MPKFVDLTNQRFGRLVVIQRVASHVSKSGHSMVAWECACDCGRQKAILGGSLMSGRTISCGCYHKENLSMLRRKHGATANRKHSREYESWAHMISRCNNPNSKDYHNYGGRGITVCEPWRSFTSFLDDMGPCPEGYTIERVNVNGGYEPANCTWIPMREQGRNQRRVRLFEWAGRNWTLGELEKHYGIARERLRWAIDKQGYTLNEAISRLTGRELCQQ